MTNRSMLKSRTESRNCKRKALVLAGGAPQIKLIKDLQDRGYYTILSDYLEHPVACATADRFYRESTLDISAILRIAAEENVELVVTCCTDQALSTVAIVSEELGLPCYVSAETGMRVTNKSLMKRVFKEEGIPTANFTIIKHGSLAPSLPYPVVVKPVDCNSSKGVLKVEDDEELKIAIDNAICLSRNGEAIIEEYMEGDELSIDCYVSRRTAQVLCISRLDKVKDESRFVISRGYCSPEIMDAFLPEALEISQQIADAFSLNDGPMLIQAIASPHGLKVVEFSARTGGCSKYKVIELKAGVDAVKAMLDTTLGIQPEIKPNYEDSIVADEFIYCKPGIFSHLEGFDECVDNGMIEEYLLLKSEGSALGGVSSSGDRIAAVVYKATTEEEYQRKRTAALTRLAVRDVNGVDIMRRDLLEFD